MTRSRSLRWIRAASLSLALLALAASPRASQAITYAGAGGQLGYASAEDLDGTAALGLHAEFDPATNSHVHLVPNLRYWMVDGVSDVCPNVDLTYHFEPSGRVTPYLGGGLGVNMVHVDHFSGGSNDLGVNMIGGLRFPGTSTRYFVEGRYTASDINQVSLVGGVTFMGH